jgi:acetylglutamate kinase
MAIPLPWCTVEARRSRARFNGSARRVNCPGVKDADGSVMPWLGLKQVPGLIQDAVIGGGMLPKLEACSHALHHGVGRVRIFPAQEVDQLPLFYFSRLQCGTEVLSA